MQQRRERAEKLEKLLEPSLRYEKLIFYLTLDEMHGKILEKPGNEAFKTRMLMFKEQLESLRERQKQEIIKLKQNQSERKSQLLQTFREKIVEILSRSEVNAQLTSKQEHDLSELKIKFIDDHQSMTMEIIDKLLNHELQELNVLEEFSTFFTSNRL